MAKRRNASRNGSRRRHSYSDYRRVTPTESERLGLSRKSRHYVLKSINRLTKASTTITARQHETMRVRELYGVSSTELATKARRAGGIMYGSARAQETAAKNESHAYLKKLRKTAQSGTRIYKYSGPGKPGRQFFTARPNHID